MPGLFCGWTISGELGIDGEKGKLWTSIQKIMEQKSPKLVLLENAMLLTSLVKEDEPREDRDGLVESRIRFRVAGH